MPMYRAIRLCFVDASLRKEGDVFEYNGPENHHLEPLEPAKPKAEAPADDASSERKWAPKAKRKADVD